MVRISQVGSSARGFDRTKGDLPQRGADDEPHGKELDEDHEQYCAHGAGEVVVRVRDAP